MMAAARRKPTRAGGEITPELAGVASLFALAYLRLAKKGREEGVSEVGKALDSEPTLSGHGTDTTQARRPQ